MKLSQSLKPSVPKRGLLAIAGVFWTFAGGMLITRGVLGLMDTHVNIVPDLLIALAGGAIFYWLLFSKISKKHIYRIVGLKPEKPCLFSFFNMRSYIMMTVMITGGITLRKLDILDHQVLYSFYVCMGTPLLVSSGRFYYHWFIYKKFIATV